MKYLSTFSPPSQKKVSLSVTIPSWRAPDIVNVLYVEPGSKASHITKFLQTLLSASTVSSSVALSLNLLNSSSLLNWYLIESKS